MGEKNDLRRECEDERAKLRVLTRYKTHGQRETKKRGTARGKKLYHNLIKLLQLGFRPWS